LSKIEVGHLDQHAQPVTTVLWRDDRVLLGGEPARGGVADNLGDGDQPPGAVYRRGGEQVQSAGQAAGVVGLYPRRVVRFRVPPQVIQRASVDIRPMR